MADALCKPHSAPDGSADNFCKAKKNLQILGDVFSSPTLCAPRKASGRDVEAGWCFLCGPLTSYLTTPPHTSAPSQGNAALSGRMCFNLMLLSYRERCISRDRVFRSAVTYFTVFCHILFLPLYFPKSLVTTINLCLGGCSSLLSIPQIVHLPWT